MKHKTSTTTSALLHEIAALRQATAADLKERWRALYSTEPPRRISRDLLVRALAYRMQERALGGLQVLHAPIIGKGGRRCVGTPADARRTSIDSQTGNSSATRVARHAASGDSPRGWHRLPGQAVQVVVGGRLPNHRHQRVGAALLRKP